MYCYFPSVGLSAGVWTWRAVRLIGLIPLDPIYFLKGKGDARFAKKIKK